MVAELLRNGANPNHRDTEGRVPLHLACKHLPDPTALYTTQQLLQAGANPSISDKQGRTALSLACQSSKPQVIQALLEYGADTNHPNFSHSPLLTLLCSQLKTESCIKGIYDFLVTISMVLTRHTTVSKGTYQVWKESRHNVRECCRRHSNSIFRKQALLAETVSALLEEVDTRVRCERQMLLQCLAARTIIKNNISHDGILPRRLITFVWQHDWTNFGCRKFTQTLTNQHELSL